MKFKESKLSEIDDLLIAKKQKNPVNDIVVGIGIRLDCAGVAMNNTIICKVEELARMIEELQMLKESIEEATGLEL